MHIWPSVAALAADLGVPYQTAAAWKRRGSIPANYDLRLISAAKRRRKKLTLSALAVARCDNFQGDSVHPAPHGSGADPIQGEGAA